MRSKLTHGFVIVFLIISIHAHGGGFDDSDKDSKLDDLSPPVASGKIINWQGNYR